MSKSTYNTRLKKANWTQWKASRLRSAWRARAKKIGISPDTIPTREEIQEWIEALIPFKCYITGVPLTKSEIEVDHKEATSRGGGFGLDNVGLTSKYYNSAKGDMSEKEFKQLLKLIDTWKDKGKSVLKRLRTSNNIFRRRRRCMKIVK